MGLYTFVRGSFCGRVLYHLSNHRLFNYEEEWPGYVIPEKYLPNSTADISETPLNTPGEEKNLALEAKKDFDNEQNAGVNCNETSEEIVPNEEEILVTWDGDDDPENPKNWSFTKKLILFCEIGYLTLSIYIGPALYTPGEAQLMQQFGIGKTLVTLPLSMFVLGYGLGPMLWSPLSENPVIGRTSIYILTLLVYVVLQIPCALSTNIGSLSALRFISGIFASPSLATGGASMADLIGLPRLPLAIAMWALWGFLGPAIGPVFGAIFVEHGSWRWTFWFLCVVDGFALVFLGLLLPETSADCLLYRKSRRLRKLTGNNRIISKADLTVLKMSWKAIAIDTLVRPIEIALLEPIVLSINCYISLVYAVLYLWFEAFPLVFQQVYGFTLIQTGTAFFSIVIGTYIGQLTYLPYIFFHYTKRLENGQDVVPETFLTPAIFGALCQPIGIFMFAWASTASIHWIVPLIGACIYGIGCFVCFQTLFNYMGLSFHDYMASVYASNSLTRSVFAAAFPLFAYQMYNNLGSEKYPVGWGCSVLGFISVAMILIPVVIRINGVKLRARSKYAS